MTNCFSGYFASVKNIRLYISVGKSAKTISQSNFDLFNTIWNVLRLF